MRRRNLAIALVVSVLLHAVLLALVWRSPPAPRVPTETEQPAPVEIEIAEAPPLPRTETPEHRAPVPPARREPARKRAEKPSQPATPSLPDRPEKTVEPAPPSLDPSDSVAGVPVQPPDKPGGSTVRPDDPSLSEWAQRAEEEHRVKERVEGWAEDAAAESRAQRGLPHPYLTRVGEKLRAALDAAPGGTPQALGAPDTLEYLFNQYKGAAEEFGKSGTSTVTVPGPSPRQTERQKELFGSESEARWLRGMTQSAETIQNLSNGTPLLSLTLELRQAPNGPLLSQRVVQRSSSSKFAA